MGMFDNASFNAPNLTSAVPSLENFLDYKRNREDEHMRRQMEFEKDMQNFQSQLRLKEMGQAMDQQRIAKSREPLNVNPPVGLVTPALHEQLENVSERNRLQSENNQQRNQIAQQNADTRRDIGEETIDARRDIAGQTLATRKDIAANSKSAFPNAQVLQKEAEGAKEHLEGTKQENRATNLDTRGRQIINAITTRGGEDRKTKETASPNTTGTIPTQKIADEKRKANEFVNRNPHMKDWVHIDPNTGLVSIDPPSNGTSVFGGAKGPSVPDYNKALTEIHGQGNSYSTPRNDNTTPVNTAPPQGSAPAGKVRVMLPDGRIGYLPQGHPSLNDPRVKVLGGGQ